MLHTPFIDTYLTFVRCAFLVFLCSLCFYVVKIPAQDFKTLKPGVEYAEVTKEISGKSVNMNLLRLDLTKVCLDVHHAMDAAIGTEKTSSIATRHGAFAAINAGFFRLDTSIWAGDAAGLLMSRSKLLSEPTAGRTALVLYNGPETTEAAFYRFEYRGFLIFGKNERISILGANRERNAEDLVLFTPEFHRTTLTSGVGLEVKFVKDKVVEIGNLVGNSNIPENGFVLSASGKYRAELLKLKRNQRVVLASGPTPVEGEPVPLPISFVQDAVAGVPRLIKNGRVDITWEQEKTSKSFVETRHPRTTVAKLKDGKFLMITVDGRSEASGGIGLPDLAEYLLSLGATDAMNLDGGGSTTMFVDGKVVNKPSDKEGERKVSDAILVTLRTKKK